MLNLVAVVKLRKQTRKETFYIYLESGRLPEAELRTV